MVNSSEGSNDVNIAQFTQQSNCSKIKRHITVLEQVFTVVTRREAYVIVIVIFNQNTA